METPEQNTGDTPLVAVAVLNWRARETTIACLDAVRALDYSNFSVVLVDNGCEDFRQESFPATPRLLYIHSEENRGYAGGCNLALERAVEAGADFVWFLNNDALPEPDSLGILVEAATASRAGIVGPKILRQATTPPRLDSVAVAIDRTSGRFRLLGHNQIDTGQYDLVTRVDAVTGCAMLVRADVAAALGGFDERYYLYLEDLDLCLRTRATGDTVIAVPRARVHHDRPPARRDRQSLDSLYYTCRNHFLLMATHGRGGSLRRVLRTLTILTLSLAYALVGSSRQIPGRLRAAIAGALDYAAGRFGPRITHSSP